jgi:predicted P-loop ATPase/GTPase
MTTDLLLYPFLKNKFHIIDVMEVNQKFHWYKVELTANLYSPKSGMTRAYLMYNIKKKTKKQIDFWTVRFVTKQIDKNGEIKTSTKIIEKFGELESKLNEFSTLEFLKNKI